MKWKTIIALAVLTGMTTGPVRVTYADDPGCTTGEKAPVFSEAAAKKKFEDAGFRRVSDLKQGCDAVWHATASKNGVVVNVVLSPQGQITLEGS